jgi:preprotein translocase subunit SecY
MWLGERISDKGIGNGISIILLINIVSRMPSDFSNLYEMFIKGKDIVQAVMAAVIIVAVVIGTTILVILLQDAERRIPVQYSKKVQGRRMAGSQASYIPLKVNTAGVIPIIFAASLLSVPSIIINLFNLQAGTTAQKILQGLNQNYWFNPEYPWASVGLILYIVLNVIFAYFYTSITFNPMEVANNMKKSGGFVPGIRPGKPTQDYLNKILNYIVLIGVIGLLIVALIPIFFNGMFSADVSFGGTSLIIIVGVILETMKQLESQMLVRNYSGFLND